MTGMRALVAGQPLDLWHSTPAFATKAASTRRGGGRISRRASFLRPARMAAMMLTTVAQANGQLVERRIKEKTTTLTREECELLLRQKMGEQEDRCALTGLSLGYDQDCTDEQMLASLDRVDSSGQYTPDNIQIVCRFMNRWKSADDDTLCRRLLGVLRNHYAIRSPPRVGGYSQRDATLELRTPTPITEFGFAASSLLRRGRGGCSYPCGCPKCGEPLLEVGGVLQIADTEAPTT